MDSFEYLILVLYMVLASFACSVVVIVWNFSGFINHHSFYPVLLPRISGYDM